MAAAALTSVLLAAGFEALPFSLDSFCRGSTHDGLSDLDKLLELMTATAWLPTRSAANASYSKTGLRLLRI
jgi:hypothetical protein